MSQTYRINAPNVVHETIDGEVVIIHLEKGIYYSLLNTATDIWTDIELGMDVETLTHHMQTKYEGDEQDIQSKIQDFIGQLEDKNLIVLNKKEASDSQEITLDSNDSEQKQPFETPIVEEFNDMEDLLLLDPIHEVTDEGWPNAESNAA